MHCSIFGHVVLFVRIILWVVERKHSKWPETNRQEMVGVKPRALMLSANSSSALAPIVSMDVMSVGSLFLVLAAVPCMSNKVQSLKTLNPANSSTETAQTPPEVWSQSQTYSSSDVWGWGRWWALQSSRGAWWPCELQTRCCLLPAWGCPVLPVDRHDETDPADRMWFGANILFLIIEVIQSFLGPSMVQLIQMNKHPDFWEMLSP